MYENQLIPVKVKVIGSIDSIIKEYEAEEFELVSVTPINEHGTTVSLLLQFRRDRDRGIYLQQQEQEAIKARKQAREEQKAKELLLEQAAELKREEAERQEEQAMLLKANKDLEEWNRYCQQAK